MGPAVRCGGADLAWQGASSPGPDEIVSPIPPLAPGGSTRLAVAGQGAAVSACRRVVASCFQGVVAVRARLVVVVSARLVMAGCSNKPSRGGEIGCVGWADKQARRRVANLATIPHGNRCGTDCVRGRNPSHEPRYRAKRQSNSTRFLPCKNKKRPRHRKKALPRPLFLGTRIPRTCGSIHLAVEHAGEASPHANSQDIIRLAARRQVSKKSFPGVIRIAGCSTEKRR